MSGRLKIVGNNDSKKKHDHIILNFNNNSGLLFNDTRRFGFNTEINMIVCEVGLNHLGNEEYSTMYMEKLSKSKCDAISYQIREPKFYAKDKYRCRKKK